MDIREATDKAMERSTWRLLVRASSSANAWQRRKLEHVMYWRFGDILQALASLRSLLPWLYYVK